MISDFNSIVKGLCILTNHLLVITVIKHHNYAIWTFCYNY